MAPGKFSRDSSERELDATRTRLYGYEELQPKNHAGLSRCSSDCYLMLLQSLALVHLLYPFVMPRAKRALEEVDLNAERPAAKSQKKSDDQDQENETSGQGAKMDEVRHF